MPRPAPRGRMVDVAGRRLHLVAAGPPSGEPLVVLEAGSYGASADWAAVQALLTVGGVRSLAYDRAGLGLSDPGPSPRDGVAIAADLERLLAALGEAGPLVLVGHSMAGLHVRLFAGRNPARIAGLVLVDAFTPEMAKDPRIAAGARGYGRLARLSAAATALGLIRPFGPFGDSIGVEGEAHAHKLWTFGNAGHTRAAADEILAWPFTAAQALAVGPADPAWPVAVVTASAERRLPAFRALQAAAASASARGRVDHVAGARHASLLGPRYAHHVVGGIEHVLKTLHA
ncbi:MAG TPA: alpha/beta hydrolase [Caulobacteraceae bacterium]|nr:alpha/beta hydrolase [Caulobacteraceae bacterium]